MTKQPRYPIAWKLYSSLIVILLLLSIVADAFTLLSVLITVLSIALTIPLIGYAWQRRLVPAWAGAVAFWLNLFGALATFYFGFGAEGIEAKISLAMPLFFAPCLYGTHAYAFHSSHLDRDKSPPN